MSLGSPVGGVTGGGGGSSRSRAPSRSVSISTDMSVTASRTPSSAWRPAASPAPPETNNNTVQQQQPRPPPEPPASEISTELVQHLYQKMDNLIGWLSDDATIAPPISFNDGKSARLTLPQPPQNDGRSSKQCAEESDNNFDTEDEQEEEDRPPTTSTPKKRPANIATDDEELSQMQRLVPHTIESGDLRQIKAARQEELGAPLAAEVQDLERALADLQERPETERYLLIDGHTQKPIASSSFSSLSSTTTTTHTTSIGNRRPRTSPPKQQPEQQPAQEDEHARDAELSQIVCALSNAFKSTCFDVEFDTFGLRHEPQDQFVMAELITTKRCLYICPDTQTNDFVLAWWMYKDSDSALDAQLQRITTGGGGRGLGKPKPSVAALLSSACGKDLDRDWVKQPDRRAYDFESYQKAGALGLILARNMPAEGGRRTEENQKEHRTVNVAAAASAAVPSADQLSQTMVGA